MNSRKSTIWLAFIGPLSFAILIAYILPLFGELAWSVTLPERGLQSYIQLTNDDYIHSVVFRTIRVCSIATIASVLIAYLLAYHWVFGPPVRRKIVEVAILFPFWISILVRTFGWLMILQPRGVLNEVFHLNDILQWLGIGEVRLVRNEFGVIVGMAHFMVPFAVFPISAVMRQIDTRILLAARGLGAGPVRRFFHVFLPLSMPGLVGACFVVFVFTLGFFITPTLLGGGRVVLIAEYVYTQILVTPNWGVASALSVFLLTFVGLMVWLLMKITRIERLVA
ncbi:ABC transporter permease [Mesorhizobium abyssinicae]|uniref:ABC transporter permease n=1 Tax=Mesorhizobium abyssinicae TaxID=1209958 RepID=UPI00339316FA